MSARKRSNNRSLHYALRIFITEDSTVSKASTKLKIWRFRDDFVILCVRTKPSFDPRAMLILTTSLYLPNVLFMDCSHVNNVKTQSL